MASSESYEELIFELGDLARAHLSEAKKLPRGMSVVFAAEDEVLDRRSALEAAEDELNQEDQRWQDFLDAQEAEKKDLKAIVMKWRSAVAGVEGRSREMKKKLSALKAAFRYQRQSLAGAETAHKEMEMREGHDARKIAMSHENLKKSRLHIMREKRNIEEREWELNQVLTPRPGQPGAQGILAHKRLLELEDELAEREHQHKGAMDELEAGIVAKEDEIKAAEDELDGALFELGEECYAARIAHARLTPLYARIDKAK